MEAIDFICSKCKHFKRFDGNCKAFPNEIPDEIISGSNRHSKPTRTQANKIVFEPIEESGEG